MNDKHYKKILEAAPFAYAYHKIIVDDNLAPVDYEFIEVNRSFEAHTGLNASKIINKTITHVLPEITKDDFNWIKCYGEIALQGGEKEFEQYSASFKRWYKVHVYSHEKYYFSTIFTDITKEKASTSEIENFFSVNLDLLCIADIEGNFIKVNKEWENILGYSVKELQKRKYLEFIHPDDMSATLQAMKQLSDQKEIINFVNRFKAKDGSYRFIEWRSKPKGILIYAAARDITDRIKAEDALIKSEKKYRLFFEKSPLGILHFNNNGHITECNDNFVKIIGSSRDVLLGKDLTKLPDKRITYAVNKVIKGHAATFEGNYSSVTADKTTPVRVLFSPLINKNKKVEGGIGLVEDRSDQIKKESLEKQVAIAKESAKFKQNFLANMSHEIRTPLTGIIGLIEIIEKTSLNSQLQEYIKILKTSSENLNEIIDQVLDFSKIEAGKVKLKLKPFQLDSLLENAKVLFNTLCDKKDIEFHTIRDKNLPEFIKADDKRITQIINNLVSNAIKFTNKGKIVLKVELDSYLKETDSLVIKVILSDTGIGIPADKHKNLFAPFSQIDKHDTRLYEGTGLGLSICKELAELHGGKINMKSKPNKGSSFWFTFIAQKATSITETKEYKKESSRRGNLNILFAEDKLTNQKVVQLMLNSMGHQVTIAKNGQQAIDLYKPGVFDIILMDIQMPLMDGITATGKLKKKYKDLPPIVGLSANAFEGDREKYMAKGLDEYLTKPVKEEDFIKLLKKLDMI